MISDKKVAHLTSAHPRADIRIFLKECRSLVVLGYSVSLIVADGKGDEEREGVHIFDVGLQKGRLNRMLRTTQRIFWKARGLDADIYHLHDPELIPVGLKLTTLGKKVVFDAHENVPKQILRKPYLNKPARWLLSQAFMVYERWACYRLSGVVTATPSIRDKFLQINANSVDINNFPMLDELSSGNVNWSVKQSKVCYVGGIARARGVNEVVQAMAYCTANVRLQLAGNLPEDVRLTISQHAGWRKVDALGFIDRRGVKKLLSESVAGLVTFHPLPNHIDAQPNKMFEYMSAGIPVIASHFPLWKEIIENNDCGLCVDPMDPEAIAAAIDFMIENPERAEQMGRNGQQAVWDHYNWSSEERKLLKFYRELHTT